MTRFRTVLGVDFSGAKLAGENIWIARADLARNRLRLVALNRLADLAGSPDREPALAHLVSMIESSRNSLWGIDFPFGLPIEVMPQDMTWRGQVDLVATFAQQAADFGRWCLERARALGGPMHIRRATDRDVATPFDCYHYRIIYQTFHGMRDVLAPMAGRNGTVVAPFEYARLGKSRRVVVEACPSSTLKRLGLPHQNYKQPIGGALTPRRRTTRRKIMDGLRREIEIREPYVRTIMRNPGGDALDAVIAAVGTHRRWTSADHEAIARHPRYPLEGYIYA